MKRQTAFTGFFKAIKECKECEQIAKADGHSCNVSTRWKMAELRARKYCKSLVMEHGYQDIHTAQFMVM